jgi:hypothetical protein
MVPPHAGMNRPLAGETVAPSQLVPAFCAV